MGRWNDFVKMVKEKRLGFRLDETMSGTHWFEPGCGPKGDQTFEFTVSWGPREIGKWVNPLSDGFMVQSLSGTVTAGGLGRKIPCRGKLEIKYFTEHKIRYTFEFTHDGVRYHYLGEKVNILPWNLPFSHTTCFGVLTETATGKLISRSVTHFRIWSAPGFLASLRLE